MDLDLDTENSSPAESRLWHIASPGQEIEKKILNDQQVMDRCNLTTYDFETLLKESKAGLCFWESYKSLLLASQQLILIWNSSACYILYDNISSKRFQDFVNAVSNGLPFDNLLVIRAALHLVYEGIQDQVLKLRSGVEDSWCFFPCTLRDLGEDGSLLSSKSNKVMAEIFDSGSPAGGVAIFLEQNQLQEYKKSWDSILEQLDSTQALLNTKLRKLKTILVLFFVVCVLFYVGLLYRVVAEPISLSSSVAICAVFNLVQQLRDIKKAARVIW